MSRSLTLKELTIVGQALFGDRWRTDVAKSLGITYAGLTRWYRVGSVPADPVYRERLRSLVRSRLEGLEEARKVLWSKAHGSS